MNEAGEATPVFLIPPADYIGLKIVYKNGPSNLLIILKMKKYFISC